MANWLNFAALFVLHFICESQGKEVTVKNVAKCPAENPPEMSFELIELDDGQLALNMKAIYDYDIDDSYRLQVTFYKMQKGDWEYQSPYEDKWCAVMLQIAKPWNLAKAALQPPLPEGCTIPSGEYTLHEFQLKKEDVAAVMERISPGVYRADILLVTGHEPNLDKVLCIAVEYEVEE